MAPTAIGANAHGRISASPLPSAPLSGCSGWSASVLGVRLAHQAADLVLHLANSVVPSRPTRKSCFISENDRRDRTSVNSADPQGKRDRIEDRQRRSILSHDDRLRLKLTIESSLRHAHCSCTLRTCYDEARYTKESPIRNQCASASVRRALHGQSLGQQRLGQHTTAERQRRRLRTGEPHHAGLLLFCHSPDPSTLRQPGACPSARRAGPRQPFATVCQEEANCRGALMARKHYSNGSYVRPAPARAGTRDAWTRASLLTDHGVTLCAELTEHILAEHQTPANRCLEQPQHVARCVG